jgi:C4-dicarboxylate transporter/malic acid transport protein
MNAPQLASDPARALPVGPNVIRDFAPGWFAAVMGTGVLATTLHAYAGRFPALDVPASLLHWANIALFIALAVPWLARWVRFPAAAIATLRHPVHAHFYPTFSIALLVLAMQFLAIARQPEIALGLWAAGAALTALFSVVVLAIVFQGESVTLDHVTPGMFIPPVGLVVIPVAGAPLAAMAPEGWRETLLVANWAALGAGTFLYLALLGLTTFRFVLHKPVTGPLVPTVWINLGPLGVIPLSLVSLGEAMPALGATGALHAAALLMWGFGLWWLAMASVLTIAAYRRGALPFALSWWALTFPLGAFVAASQRLGSLLDLAPIYFIGLAALALLAAFWTVTLARTVRGAASGALFRAA